MRACGAIASGTNSPSWSTMIALAVSGESGMQSTSIISPQHFLPIASPQRVHALDRVHRVRGAAIELRLRPGKRQLAAARWRCSTRERGHVCRARFLTVEVRQDAIGRDALRLEQLVYQTKHGVLRNHL